MKIIDTTKPLYQQGIFATTVNCSIAKFDFYYDLTKHCEIRPVALFDECDPIGDWFRQKRPVSVEPEGKAEYRRALHNLISPSRKT